MFQSSYRQAFSSFWAQWKIQDCKACIKNKLEKTLPELWTAQIVKAKHVGSFLPKTTDETRQNCPTLPLLLSPLCSFQFSTFAKSRNRNRYSELLRRAMESRGRDWSLEILGMRQSAAERWAQDSCLYLCFSGPAPVPQAAGGGNCRSVCVKPFPQSQPKGESWGPSQGCPRNCPYHISNALTFYTACI